MKAQKIKKNKARERREKEWDAELELEESMFNMLCPKKKYSVFYESRIYRYS